VRKILPIALVLLALSPSGKTHATTGYSQIVTPDIEPEGQLSISAQLQSERIGNPYEVQMELGLFKRAEVAIFKGFKPNELIFSALKSV